MDEARRLFAATPGLVVVDDLEKKAYPMPIHCEGRNETFIGRMREDLSSPNGLAFWCVSDNLRKGAATNAVQIAELLVKGEGQEAGDWLAADGGAVRRPAWYNCWRRELPDVCLIASRDRGADLRPRTSSCTCALGLFLDDRVTLGQGAAVAGLSQTDFLHELGKRRIPVHYDVAEALADVAIVERGDK